MADEQEPLAKTWFETVKGWSEAITGGYAPWWVVPVAVVVFLAIIF